MLFLSAIQSLSGACLALIHAYKQAISTIRLVNKSSVRHSVTPPLMSPLRPESPSGANLSRSLSRGSSYSFTGLPSPPPDTPQYPPSPEVPVDKVLHDLARGPLMLLCQVLRLQWRFSSSIAFNLVAMACCFFTTFINKYVLSVRRFVELTIMI